MTILSVDELRVYARLNSISPHHPNAWGSIFRGREWAYLGAVRSKLPTNHGRFISIWNYSPVAVPDDNKAKTAKRCERFTRARDLENCHKYGL